MGEIVVGLDASIGREVAIKRLREGNKSEVAVGRFLREARIQARLEHPAIVPVHALGADANGNPFFTMKRLAGETLADRLRAKARPSQQELLRWLVDVCQAIALAHRRGVIHRDLKPANIMVGELGEVYVLDWGIARIVDEHETVARGGDVTTLDGLTEAGALFGTPGYMAPEQAEGSLDVGRAADVYALGAILFEILAGETLHPIGRGAIASTLSGIDGSPARRRPERAIAPELDALCSEALALDPARRPSALEFAARIQGYLDGDRDVAHRTQLAKAELASARAALESGDVTRRAAAIRSAGRALALDPESHDAAIVITTLMLEPPAAHPPELAAELAASDAAVQQRQGRVATLTFAAALLLLGAAALNGTRDAISLGAMAVYTLALAGFVFGVSRHAASKPEMWIICIGNAILAALLSRVFGPLVVAPVICCIMTVSLTSYPQLMYRAPIVIGILIASWAGPVLLERAGVLASTWSIADGKITTTSTIVEIGGTSTTILVIGANILGIIVIGLFANALARSRHAAQRNVEIQAWQLRQLLPDR